MYFRQILTTAFVCVVGLSARAATIVVDVRDPKGAPLADAVVYAAPEGREMPAAARTAVMDQKNKTFVPHVLPVQVGTAVRFPNSDDIKHQVYSFSAAKTFNLPLYKGTPSNPIVFPTPGVVTLGCNIHDTMNAYIVIVETPYFEKTESSGRVELRNVPAGKYVVRAWHPDMKDEPAAQMVTVADSVEIAFTVVAAPKAMTTAPLKKLEDKFKKYGDGRP